MIFKRFRNIAISYIILILVTFGIGFYILLETYFWLTSVWLFILDVLLIYWFIRFIRREYRKLTNFIISIEQEDFSQPSSKNYMDVDFNYAFQKLAEVISRLRDEAQINYQFLQTIVNHVNVAIVCVDKDEKITITNQAATNLFNKSVLRNIDSLKIANDDLPSILRELEPSNKKLIKILINNEMYNYSIESVNFKLGNDYFKLFSFHNVQSELEQNELISWQKLTRVITHEIMNSAIPISNLSGLVFSQLFNDNKKLNELDIEQIKDIKEGLNTIESRSKGLVKFVEATRNFTKMPKPELEIISINEIIKKILALLKMKLDESKVRVDTRIEPADLTILADNKMIEQVLINIILNAIDSFDDGENGKIEISAFKNSENHVVLSIQDNGKGIEQSSLNDIFIPFYTTKEKGSGIGLSISKQIMYLHKGNISVKSETKNISTGKQGETTFTLTF